MTALAIRRTAWEGLIDVTLADPKRNQHIFRFMGDKLALGNPAHFLDGSMDRWFVFDDTRFKPKPMAYFGCVAANVGEIPSGYTVAMVDVLDKHGNPTGEQEPEDRPGLVADIKAFCENPARGNPLVLPDDPAYPDIPDDPNPWQTLLDAQGTPAAMKMAGGVPASWTPVVVEP